MAGTRECTSAVTAGCLSLSRCVDSRPRANLSMNLPKLWDRPSYRLPLPVPMRGQMCGWTPIGGS
jgi:hypothetical protein